MSSKEDAARMIIGPESRRTDLLDATDDVIRELVQLRRTREALILAGDALRAENERLREELAEWKAAHAHVVRLRELIESHMDTARGKWVCQI